MRFIVLALILCTSVVVANPLPAPEPVPAVCPDYLCAIPIAWHEDDGCCLATCGGDGDTPVPKPWWCKNY
ncbi:hypothetical protein CALCODRAFT_494508 [Calocera cornea HHB12733]|uniref:Uncharacterized protein n=1 Tax=Calocera cornea HHB12733 TaxID=1353952 RepID=A0A165H310_9BASI|nr:hypothetical protein CALCODRAFT_494508 [Calocera cornea HHB12733]